MSQISVNRMDRVPTGIDGLDDILDGGIPPQTATLVSGGPGTGKTLMGLTYVLEGAKRGEKCCYLTLNEGLDDLLRACSIGELSEIEDHLGKNLSIVELTMGEQTDLEGFRHLLDAYPKTDRIVIDNVNKLLIHSDSKRAYRILMSSIIRYLKANINSSLLICETEKDSIDTGNGEAFECDGVIVLSYDDMEEVPRRLISIPKMRYTKVDGPSRSEYVIGEGGLALTGKEII